MPNNMNSALKDFLKSLVPFGSPSEPIGHAEAETKVNALVQNLVKHFNGKVSSKQQKHGEGGILFYFKATVGGRVFTLKAWVVYESRVLNLTLWTADGKDMLEVLAILEIDKKLRIQAISKARANRWFRAGAEE